MKESLFKSEKHRRFVESLPCIIAHQGGCSGDVICHHVGGLHWTGSIKRQNDYLSCPMCVFHHEEVHRIGKGSFEEKYAVVWRNEIIKVLMRRIKKLEGK